MKEITIWEIHEWDGREYQYYRGKAMESKAAAEAYQAKHPQDAVVERTILIFASLQDMDDHSNKKLRETALAKLTTAEKKILGLKP